MNSCSSVPFSFSRTIAIDESMIAIIWQRTTIRPGMKKLGERVSGLKSTRGRESTGMGRSCEQVGQRLLQRDGVAHVDGLGRDARLGAVHQDQHLRGLAGLELPRVVRGDLDPDAGPAGDQGLGQVLVGEDLAHDPEILGVLEPLQQGPALLGAGLVVDHRADVPHVGVDGVAEHEQLDHGMNRAKKSVVRSRRMWSISLRAIERMRPRSRRARPRHRT